MFAAIYARKSTEQTGVADEQRSVARQVEHARAYAAEKGWLIAEPHVYIDDGISGAEFAARPAFLRLMNALKPTPPFQVLIMSEESRLGRESIETAYALKQIITANVRVFFYLEDRERTLDSPMDKIMLSLTTFADELEREKARQRTYDAIRRKAQAGWVTGGRLFGYDNIEVPGPDGRTRSHVERRINEPQAAVVRRIFELAARGCGKKRIAKMLNEEGALCPRPQQGRPAGWSPSSVFEVLARPIYRGEIVWNTTRKRDKWGRKHQKMRPETEWLRIPAPHLAIVSPRLWQEAQHRLTQARNAYLDATGGRSWGRPSVAVEPKYLLSGLAVWATCGGSLYVRRRVYGSRGNRRRALFYGCASYHLRGRTICPNCMELPMEGADRAVLGTLRDDLLQPDVVRAAVSRALEYLQPESDRGRRLEEDALKTELAEIERQLARLSAAIAAGGELPALLMAMQERERRREEATERVRAVRAVTTAVEFDAKRVERELLAELAQWREVLAEDVRAARPVLSRLLAGRLKFKPLESGVHVPCEFSGNATSGGMLTRTVGVQKRWRPQPDSPRRTW